jgi:hypothetical protein
MTGAISKLSCEKAVFFQPMFAVQAVTPPLLGSVALAEVALPLLYRLGRRQAEALSSQP